MIFRHLLNMRSHPTWVRGLKPEPDKVKGGQAQVAPYVGAWIETKARLFRRSEYPRRTLRGCVD